MPAEHSAFPVAPLRVLPRSRRVVLADGEALVRAGLLALLEGDGTVTVVGEAASGEETLALAGSLSPDVVLIDVGLPGLDSVEVTRRLLADSGVPVMLLTTSETDDRIFAALRAGASGLVLKDADPDELLRAVEVLARGDALLSPRLTSRLIAHLASRPEPRQLSDRLDGELGELLTAREREVLTLVAMGLSNHEIAEELVVSPATARTHVSRAMVKLGARDRSQLVVFAYENGVVTPPSNGRAAG
jgi:DNA-binding NarL/FixJ family response regulator